MAMPSVVNSTVFFIWQALTVLLTCSVCIYYLPGFDCTVDPLLVAAIRNQKPEQGEDPYVLSCLLMVFIAIILPRRASSMNTTFEATLQGHANNLHCVGK